MLSSRLDAIELPLILQTKYISVGITFESYWSSSGAVYDEYHINKVILAIVDDSNKISLSNHSYGKFELDIAIDNIGYKIRLRNKLPISISVGDVCFVCINMKKHINGYIEVIVIMNGYTLFNHIIPGTIDIEYINTSYILIGGGRSYTRPGTNSVSLCGKPITLYVDISNGTEVNVELDKVLIDVGNGFEPLLDIIPADLGIIKSGDKVNIPIQFDSKNTTIDLNILWSINR